MLRRHTLVLLPLALLSIAAYADGCVARPFDGSYAPPASTIDFRGGLEQPNLPVSLEAYNWVRDRWDQVATARSSATPVEITGGRILYEFSMPIVPQNLPRYTELRTTGWPRITFRVRQGTDTVAGFAQDPLRSVETITLDLFEVQTMSPIYERVAP